MITDTYASLRASIPGDESGRDGENLEKLSMETTVLNVHCIIGFHMTLMSLISKGQPWPSSSGPVEASQLMVEPYQSGLIKVTSSLIM